MLSTNCEKQIQIVVIKYERNSIITGPTVCNRESPTTTLFKWFALVQYGSRRSFDFEGLSPPEIIKTYPYMHKSCCNHCVAMRYRPRMGNSVYVLAETSVRSPHRFFMLIIRSNLCRIQMRISKRGSLGVPQGQVLVTNPSVCAEFRYSLRANIRLKGNHSALGTCAAFSWGPRWWDCAMTRTSKKELPSGTSTKWPI